MRPRVMFLFFLSVILTIGLLYFSTAVAGTNQWTTGGPFGGKVNAVAISPNFATDGTVFAGTEFGEVFKSTNGGTSWSAANNGLPATNGSIKSFAISSVFATDGTIFAGVYGANGGIYRSTDGGASWIRVNASLTGVRAVAASPNFAADGTVFAGTENSGAYKSTDGGNSWTPINNGLTNQTVYSLALSPNFATDHTVFAGTWAGGIYKSTDGGGSWTGINTGFSQDIYSLAISPNFASDGILFAGTNGGGVYKSADSGANWSQVINGMSTFTYAYYVNSISLSPGFVSDGTVFAGTQEGIYKSANGGASWTQVNAGLTDEHVMTMAASPAYPSDNVIFTGTDGGGVYKSIDGGNGWTQFNSGVTGEIADALVFSPDFASDNTVFAGTNGGGIFKSTNGGAGWTEINSGLADWNAGIKNWKVGSLAISPNFAVDSTVFAGTNASGVYKSIDGGASWSSANTGLSNTFNIQTLSISPNFTNDGIILAGVNYGGIYRSVNDGASWTQVLGLSENISALTISPDFASDGTAFAGDTANGIYKSTDGGASWAPADTGLTNKDVYCLAVSPDFALDGTIFAADSDTWSGGVFKSTDGGASWTETNSGITAQHVFRVAVSPNFASDKTVLAGTDSGVFKSTDGGASWAPINAGLEGLPDQEIDSLTVSPNYVSDYTFYAGTGSGVFTYTISDTTPPVITNVLPTGSINSTAATISADYSDADSGVRTASVAVYLDGNPLQGCTASPSNVSCPVTGLATGAHTITGSVTDNAGNTSPINGSFSVMRNYFWTWYDDLGGDNWVLMANPVRAAADVDFGLILGGTSLDLSGYGGGVIAPGASIEPRFGKIGGPLLASSLTGAGAVVSQRSLWPKNGSSLEEIPGMDESSLSNDYFWTWYDQTEGRLNWVMVANPSASSDVYYQISIAGGCASGDVTRCAGGRLTSLGDATGPDKVEKQFDGIIGGPVEVKGCSAALDAYGACPGSPETLIASQRVISNGGLAFNEVPGTAAADLSSDYLWTWYDQTQGKLDWVMISNPSAAEDMYFEVDIAGTRVLDDASVNPATGNSYGPVGPGASITPQFPGQINGPVEVKTFADQAHTQPLDSITSQRSIIGPSFEEVPGYPRSALASSYDWTWYDELNPAVSLNWVMVSNPGAAPVHATVSFKNQDGALVSLSSDIAPGADWLPDFPTRIGGPVNVAATGGPILASQRMLWHGYFNEVMGQR